MSFDWLKIIKFLSRTRVNCACGYGWEISKAGNNLTRGTTIMLFDEMGEDENSGMWLSYEKALSAGIDAALKILED